MNKKFNTYNDKELIKILKNGSKDESNEAFRHIYSRYSARIHAYCLKTLSDPDLAEDIFQDTFIRFYQKVKTDYTNGTTAGFLITIARNLCLNSKRDKKPTVPFEDYHQIFDFDKQGDREENQKLLQFAMSLLDFEYKEPLILRIYNGLNYKDIAEILEITPENARKRVFRAKEKIKKILEPYVNDLSD